MYFETLNTNDTICFVANRRKSSRSSARAVPSTPFRVLDAPLLRDDFYCSTLAYCSTSHKLAVGLGSRVYLWSERSGVQYPPLSKYRNSNYVVSLAFSSHEGRRSILAVGRRSGRVSLWSTCDSDVRFEVHQPNAVSCVAFRQKTTRRPSERFIGLVVDTEELAVGDDVGNIWYYSVEWTDANMRERHSCNGSVVLLAKIAAHTQQICGLAWSPDGKYLATGGNDNACLLFDMRAILVNDNLHRQIGSEQAADDNIATRFVPSRVSRLLWHQILSQPSSGPALDNELPHAVGSNMIVGESQYSLPSPPRTAYIPVNSQKQRFHHGAAVKAIAFAPWQPSLLATGGGSNDRCIRFFHTPSGACLATINVHAQVTSLIWSKTRREIAATFGYAQPEHPYRIAVFEWPSCEQIVAIPWGPVGDCSNQDSNVDCGRALWAIGYPGAPNNIGDSEDSATRRTSTEDSIPHTPARRQPSTTRNGIMSPSESVAESSVADNHSVTGSSEGGTWWSRTVEEGCIVVASSDECVKFHEIWSGGRRNAFGSPGLFGGSRLLEGLEGIEKDGTEVIR